MPVPVPQGEGEHATEMVDAVFAPLFPGMDDGFGVGAGLEMVAEGGQFRNQIDEIVDFAVEHHPDRIVLIGQGLLAGGDVDDGQPSMPQPQPRLDVQASFVRAAMPLHVVDAGEHIAVDGALFTQVEDAGYAAHVSSE